MNTYPLCDTLTKNPAKYCAALVVTQNLIQSEKGWPCLAGPSDALRNGTLTFVRSGDRVFGITCWHVIQHFREQLKLSGDPYSHSMRTMVNGFYIVLDRFVRPPPRQFGAPEIDIAIRELDPNLLSTIGKEALDLDLQQTPPQSIAHAYGVGFPETMKYIRMEDNVGYRVSMPQVEILAEINTLPTCRFTMFSELEAQPIQTDFSGMSGGPIFWSTEDNFGILGIIYEGGVISSDFSDGRSVCVYGELATPPVIREWITHI